MINTFCKPIHSAVLNQSIEARYKEIEPFLSYYEKSFYTSEFKKKPLLQGEIHYHYKRANTYPARIYTFVHGQMWNDRNFRPMGLFGSKPFLKRAMTIEELTDAHFTSRFSYYQYESWDSLLIKENNALKDWVSNEIENANKFLEELHQFSKMFIIG